MFCLSVNHNSISCCSETTKQPYSCAAAKNLILSGVRSVTLQDAGEVELSDLAAQFYLTEADLGKNRAEACISKLQELNNAVHVTAHTEAIKDSFLLKFQVGVCSEISRSS